mmetsp:Transcript_29348/g.85155  ORF Transcript_29348/g.85155 Transcript_29348/m.85155 type:complete len:200 (+) Transcript_29348:736-1335(+)
MGGLDPRRHHFRLDIHLGVVREVAPSRNAPVLLRRSLGVERLRLQPRRVGLGRDPGDRGGNTLESVHICGLRHALRALAAHRARLPHGPVADVHGAHHDARRGPRRLQGAALVADAHRPLPLHIRPRPPGARRHGGRRGRRDILQLAPASLLHKLPLLGGERLHQQLGQADFRGIVKRLRLAYRCDVQFRLRPHHVRLV